MSDHHDGSGHDHEENSEGQRPEHTSVDQTPTVASVAAVASTTADLEAAEPSHPDRPVGVNVDTVGLGVDEYQIDAGSATGDEPESGQPERVGGLEELDDTGLFEGDDERFGGGHVGAGVPGELDSEGDDDAPTVAGGAAGH